MDDRRMDEDRFCHGRGLCEHYRGNRTTVSGSALDHRASIAPELAPQFQRPPLRDRRERLSRWAIAAAIAVALLPGGAIGSAARQQAKSPASPTPSFRDVAVQVGLDFIHVNGASNEKFLPEIIGPGGLFL